MWCQLHPLVIRKTALLTTNTMVHARRSPDPPDRTYDQRLAVVQHEIRNDAAEAVRPAE